jgi:hypothetical protein
MTTPSAILDRLRLGTGLSERDRPRVVAALGSLPQHLVRWDPDDIALEVRVKERDGDEQLVTLEARLPGWPPLIATAQDRDLERALREARHELIRQIEDRRDLERPAKGGGRRPA